jgi:hypothetical protein
MSASRPSMRTGADRFQMQINHPFPIPIREDAGGAGNGLKVGHQGVAKSGRPQPRVVDPAGVADGEADAASHRQFLALAWAQRAGEDDLAVAPDHHPAAPSGGESHLELALGRRPTGGRLGRLGRSAGAGRPFRRGRADRRRPPGRRLTSR